MSRVNLTNYEATAVFNSRLNPVTESGTGVAISLG